MQNENEIYVLQFDLPDATAGDEYILKDGMLVHFKKCNEGRMPKNGYVSYEGNMQSYDISRFFKKKGMKEDINSNDRPMFSYNDLGNAFLASRQLKWDYAVDNSENFAKMLRYNAEYPSFEDYIKHIGIEEGIELYREELKKTI